MAVAKLESGFSAGEIAPSLYGRFDLARLSVAASTCRNMVTLVTGGAMSRAGTKFVGFSKQTGRAYPPRMVTFQFNLTQGLALEFGNFYMRVIENGEFVTEAPIAISGISQDDPAVVSSSGTGVTAASPITSGVVTTYAPGDLVTIAGGTFLTAAVLSVTNTKLVSLLLNSPGTGVYAPADTINLSGGTTTTTPVVTVNSTQVVSATVAAAGTGGTPGTATVTGTTGTGTKFQAEVTIDGGGTIASVDAITVAGAYTVNPTAPTVEPVTGGGLSGAQLNVSLGVLTFTIFNAGVFTANAAAGAFTQGATSGTGAGATFQQGVFGPNATGVSVPGVYTVVPSNPAAQDSSTGGGLGATFTLTTASVAAFADGDWVYVSGVGGMTEVNGQTYVIDGATSSSFELYDVYGDAIDSTGFGAYSGGGTVARIYTAVSPYSEVDLKYLKGTQDKDVMSLCCVNQETLTEYPAYELSRNADDDWSFDIADMSVAVDPPTGGSGSASTSGTTFYQYVITSIDPDTGTESVASDIISVDNAVNVAGTAGSITLTWTPAPGVRQQNVYKALPGFSSAPPPGSQFGFAGYAFGAQFQDSNITADFAQVPPEHRDPFARGQITGATPVTVGTGYTTATATITTSTGSGADLEPIIVSGGVVAFILKAAGQNYAATDTVTITGNGTGATALLSIGPQSGTYPGVVSYFQQRRCYAYSINLPDTYWMSKPGAFTNFDSRIPTIDSDAITGSPWSTKVDGIQWMIQTAGGLLVFTGTSNWMLVGAGSFATNVQAITPSSQVATPQPENGCSATIPPIKINYDVIYVSSKGSFYFDQPYQLYALSEPLDLTPNSSHLFVGYTLLEHAWCQQPYRTVWAVRDDGVALTLSFLKQQEVSAFTRHDTNGLFVSVCSVTEPPVDAAYFAVQRFPGSHTAYMIERMDNRIWANIDDAWCVDCGIALPQPEPAATLYASSATGLGTISGTTGLVGGAGYTSATFQVVAATVAAGGSGGTDGTQTVTGTTGTGTKFQASVTVSSGAITAILSITTAGNYTVAPTSPDPVTGASLVGATLNLTVGALTGTTVSVVDDNGEGPGTGADIVPVIAAGVITSLFVRSGGTGYTRPAIVIRDSAGSAGGSGASATATLNNQATFTASASVFSSGNIGDVIRAAGGRATITAVPSGTEATVNITVPLTGLIPNSGGAVAPQPAGTWTMTTPTATIGGLQYLAGATVTGVADGVEIDPTVVPASGTIDLPQASTNVVAGLAFLPQLQSVYVDAGEPTIQGQRKSIPAITARVQASGDFEMGCNQPDGAAQNPIQIAPEWANMVDAPIKSVAPYGSTVKPLYTGDVRIPIKGGFDTRGQAAVQQPHPFPLTVLAFIPEIDSGDRPQVKFPKEERGQE